MRNGLILKKEEEKDNMVRITIKTDKRIHKDKDVIKI